MTERGPSLSNQPAVGDSAAGWAEHASNYNQYLLARGYVPTYVQECRAAVHHFSTWMVRANRCPADTCETLVAEFREAHRRRARGTNPTHRQDSVRTALVHLLAALRAAGAIAPKPLDATPVGRELRSFDRYMSEARGLAASTRENTLRIVGRLLRKLFVEGDIEFNAVTPEHVRAFFAEQAKLYTTPASLSTVVASLRGYFRWRATLGDRTHALVGAVSYAANWQLASLPQSLTPGEVEQLIAALGQSGPSMRRADAMVRCALDLGLRIGEVAGLSMDDIDWDAGTITLRRTKGRRADVMPLPVATGDAIAAYLRYERPKTLHRMVFSSHQAPRERCLCTTVVGDTIRDAYARAGLSHTRAHLLRHTMASRLLAGGSSLKEVADVLRHRSLNATLVYAKLDSRHLVEVALPWPGTSATGSGRQA
jgi:site-specific recombinase XerD